MKNVLAEYKEVNDIIVFGSTVKNKLNPRDIDLAIISYEKNNLLIGEIKDKLKIKNLDIELLKPDEVYQTRLGLVLISEGFSIRHNKFLKEIIGIKPMKIYVYSIKDLNQSKKVLFGRGLNTILKGTGATKLGAGSVIVPINQCGGFEDFLDTWNLKFKTKEYLVL